MELWQIGPPAIPGSCVSGPGRAGRAARSDVAAALDDDVAAACGRRAGRAGPSGLRADGGPAAAAGRVQPAEHRQDAATQAASRSRCAVRLHQRAGQGPSGRRSTVISVDSKKQEQLGQLPAAGREWRPKGDPAPMVDHSFSSMGPEILLAIPDGAYDLGTDAGWVNVGVDHDTSAFAAASIRRWWAARGALDHPSADRLLITADAGGSNSYRYRLWKAELAADQP
ncbi:hypothetical protein D0Z06_24805 [Geodermatophilus marinus]|nr:hypothetical protein D0Z06_24805 [Geodermatophilus sp. LHW52908]